MLRVDLDGVFFTLRAAIRHMVERGEGGSVVVTSSVSTLMGAPRNQAYASAKGGDHRDDEGPRGRVRA